MLAVNDPFVVLLASNARFMKPVTVGDKLTASAKVTDTADNRRSVWCEVTNQNGTKVFEGEFLCMVLERHVLER
jgi:acyl dehydratase